MLLLHPYAYLTIVIVVHRVHGWVRLLMTPPTPAFVAFGFCFICLKKAVLSEVRWNLGGILIVKRLVFFVCVFVILKFSFENSSVVHLLNYLLFWCLFF